MVKTTEKGEIVPFSANITQAKHIRESFYNEIKIVTNSKSRYDKFHTTTKNRVCFKDGVLDFKEKKFYTWDKIDFEYYSTIMINRDFRAYFEKPDMKAVDAIKNDLFVNMYGDKTTIALEAFSRGITGNCQDKNFMFYIGNRDCGKGVLYDAFSYALENYVRTFELGNILYNRKTSGIENVDCSKKLYWLIDFEFVRLGISQETPPLTSELKASSKMMKKMAGGGDTIVARRNYDRVDTHFTIETTWGIFGNNSLDFDANDTWEHALEFSSVNQFKTVEEIERFRREGMDELELKRYKVKDDKIKEKCKTEEWSNALVYLMYLHYKDKPVTIIRDTEDEDENISIMKKIKENYEFTNNAKDLVLCSDVYELLGEDKKKIGDELKSINIFKEKSKTKEFRDKLVFIGIRIKQNGE